MARHQWSGVIRVLLADCEPAVREGLRTLLEACPGIRVVGEAGDGKLAVELTNVLKPDVVLMDIRMPRLDGLAALRVLTGPGSGSEVKVIMLARFTDDAHDALRGGASGYLVKGCSASLVREAIEAALSGGTLVSPTVTARLLRRLGRQHGQAGEDTDGRLGSLSAREVDTVKLVALGMTNEEIATRLFISLPTVKSHLNRVLTKLGFRNRVEVAVWAHRTELVG